jgi:hypothetical protein
MFTLQVGVSLSGSYLDFKPDDSDELHDMLKTSGLGLGKEDIVTFFRYFSEMGCKRAVEEVRVEPDQGFWAGERE